jgi:hypothetical protein
MRCATPDAGLAEQRPTRRIDGGLVSDGERRQHAGHLRRTALQEDCIAPALARGIELFVGPPPTRPVQAAGVCRRAGADAAGRAYALLEKVELGVEAPGIHRAVGALQAQRQLPALAGQRVLWRAGHAWFAQAGPGPRKPQVRGQLHGPAIGGAGRAVRSEDEMQALGVDLRQADDATRGDEIQALEGNGQGVGHPVRASKTGQAERQQCTDDHGDRHAHGANSGLTRMRRRHHRARQCHSGQSRDNPIGHRRPEHRLLKLTRRARQPRQGQRGNHSSLHAPV